ncbi:hypothetical protein JHW43_000836 [Diplocarpon mali]|nr:hypothetical protein JHW43_000836 [Diplocarpon mali]
MAEQTMLHSTTEHSPAQKPAMKPEFLPKGVAAAAAKSSTLRIRRETPHPRGFEKGSPPDFSCIDMAPAGLKHKGKIPSKRSILYQKMISHHENAVESSEDEIEPVSLAERDEFDNHKNSHGHGEQFIPRPGAIGSQAQSAARAPATSPLAAESVTTAQVDRPLSFRPKHDLEESALGLAAGPARASSREGGMDTYTVETDQAAVIDQIVSTEICLAAQVDDGSDSSYGQGQHTPDTPFGESFYIAESEDRVARTPTQYSPDDESTATGPGDPSSKVFAGDQSDDGIPRPKYRELPDVHIEDFRNFPPFSNQDYYLTSDGRDPKFSRRIPQAGPTLVPRYYVKATILSAAEANGREKAESVDRPAITAVCGSETEEDSDDLVELEDTEARRPGKPKEFGNASHYGSGTEPMHCKVCEKFHIPPGSTISLSIRDTCGSFLPAWFPAENYPRGHAWRVFTGLINEIKKLEDYESGRMPLKIPWDKYFHEEHPKWAAAGYPRGGWFKCRDGPDASPVERSCKSCRRPPSKTELQIERENPVILMEHVMARKQFLQTWVDDRQRIVAEKDKAIALQVIRDEMMPQQPLASPAFSTFSTSSSVGSGSQESDSRGKGKGKGKESETDDCAEETSKSDERAILEAMWNHQGPMSTLKIPEQTSSSTRSTLPDRDEDALMMKSSGPRSVSHRQSSSLGTPALVGWHDVVAHHCRVSTSYGGGVCCKGSSGTLEPFLLAMFVGDDMKCLIFSSGCCEGWGWPALAHAMLWNANEPGTGLDSRQVSLHGLFWSLVAVWYRARGQNGNPASGRMIEVTMSLRVNTSEQRRCIILTSGLGPRASLSQPPEIPRSPGRARSGSVVTGR